MTKRNPNIALLSANYLFPEINRRKIEFLQKHPDAKIINLGIGDTSEPLPQIVAEGLEKASKALGTLSGYHGYGPDQGNELLRMAIAEKIYQNTIHPNDIFISDGAKCDLGRLQVLFGPHVTIAVQDPSYPVYLDGSSIQGVKKIIKLPCLPENDFFPNLEDVETPDVIYWCSPNNPTGTTSTKTQLKQLVDYAIAHNSLIVFDAAYASYIRDEKLPKTIYEIPGAETVAIELGSFSKLAGFSGIRLGWSVVPSTVLYDDGSPVKNDWKRVFTTIFNGASSISQAGGLAALSSDGFKEVIKITDFYLENARILKKVLIDNGTKCFGGTHAPYLWTQFPGKSSWDAFNEILSAANIITTPGSGFGPSGEGFLRFSAFGHRSSIIEAAERLKLKLCALTRDCDLISGQSPDR